jgi:hypothetical protein
MISNTALDMGVASRGLEVLGAFIGHVNSSEIDNLKSRH